MNTYKIPVSLYKSLLLQCQIRFNCESRVVFSSSRSWPQASKKFCDNYIKTSSMVSMCFNKGVNDVEWFFHDAYDCGISASVSECAGETRLKKRWICLDLTSQFESLELMKTFLWRVHFFWLFFILDNFVWVLINFVSFIVFNKKPWAMIFFLFSDWNLFFVLGLFYEVPQNFRLVHLLSFQNSQSKVRKWSVEKQKRSPKYFQKTFL